MIHVYFVMDGPRDHVTVPTLVGRILGVNIRPETNSWARLRMNRNVKGYHRKLRFAVLQAKDAGAAALVVVVDRDKSARQEKLKELKAGRDEDQVFPTAIGQAEPHGEAWLLDDPVAIRRGLGLDMDAAVPNIRDVSSPKDEIERLKNESECSLDPILDVLATIAGHVDISRYQHARETGFDAFQKEVRQHLGPLVKGCSPDCPCGDECR